MLAAGGVHPFSTSGDSEIRSADRSTGQHIQHTGTFDNAGSLWQPDMSTEVKTIGHRMAALGYHAAYQGKWHLSYNLDQAKRAIEAPLADYRKIIQSYGFDDFFGVGDIIDTTLGGYNYDDTTTASRRAGSAPKVRLCGRQASPGISPSISSIRMT
jgi:arylsulfatase A-like enzyme